MSILITGFEPFGGDSENPSRLSARAAVELLKADGHAAHFLEVPCVFATACPTVTTEAARVGAEIVICCGLAARRKAVSLESTAKNIIDARIPDNAGGQPRGVEVVVGAPKTLPTRLPIEKAREAIARYTPALQGDEGAQVVLNGAGGNGIKVEISDDAGEYVCNALMYGILQGMDEGVSAGFVHVPLFKEVSRDEQAEAIAIVAKESVAARIRLRKAQGKCLGGA